MQVLRKKMVSQFFFPLHESLKNHPTRYWLKFFQQAQYWEKDKLKNWQQQQLKNLLLDTYQYHEFYKAFWRHQPACLNELPIINKQLLKTYENALLPPVDWDFQTGYTSGSSGTPLFYYQSRHRVARDIAAKWRCFQWFGLDMGDREAVVWGSPLEWKRYTWLHRLRDRVMNTRLFPVMQIDHPHMQTLLGQLLQYQPEILIGYPSVLEQLIQLNSLTMIKKLKLKAVLTTAEELLPHTQHFLEKTLQCPVINSYGAREAGFIAQACPQGNLHIMAENILLEIIDPETDQVLPMGHVGDLVVTNLSSYGYPIIRYRIGDVGMLTEASCGCGIQLPILKRLEGRNTDFIVNAQNKKIHRAQFSAIFSSFPLVHQFKIIQHSAKKIEVICAPSACLADDLKQLKQKMQDCVGETVDIIIRTCDRLTQDAKEKHRFIENRMLLQESL